MTQSNSNIYRAAGVSVALGVFCVFLILLGGLGSRFGWVHFRTGLNLLAWAAWLAPIVIALSVATLVMSFIKSAKVRAYTGGLIGLLLALAVYIPNQLFRERAESLPRIHDITTDTVNPPEFVKVRELRDSTTNSLEYEGEIVADQQKAAYPDIEPVTVSMGKTQAFEAALTKALALNWEIVDASPEDGRIEATDTTLIFGFKDDVVIRLTELSEDQTKVDIRSVSRVGLSDVGANADRIRKFLKGF